MQPHRGGPAGSDAEGLAETLTDNPDDLSRADDKWKPIPAAGRNALSSFNLAKALDAAWLLPL